MRVLVFLLLLPLSCAAQQLPDSSRDKFLPDSPTPKSESAMVVASGETSPQHKASRRTEILEHGTLTALGETFSMLDAHSTREGINLPRVHEGDPIFRPFVHSDGLYAVQSAEIGALAWVGWKMHHSHNGFFRTMWWIPQTAQIGANIAGWQNNRSIIASASTSIPSANVSRHK